MTLFRAACIQTIKTSAMSQRVENDENLKQGKKMASFKIDGRIFRTENSVQSWREETQWDGRNQISVNTGSQWQHERLYQSRKGTYWVVYSSQWQGSVDSASIVSDAEAAAWLLLNSHDIPLDLESVAESIEE